jgi:16S rRNA (guanine(966)-N(2))-methyltransferase RsmD
MPKARVIAGTHRHLTFETGDFPQTRPTKDRVKESLFNQLSPLNRFDSVLDLFAGTGSLGFEAFSRGAQRVTLVESDLSVFQLLKSNTVHLKMEVTAICMDALRYLKEASEAFDLILLDPPYQSTLLEDALTFIHQFKLLSLTGLIVGLHEKDITASLYQIKKHRKLGRTQITVWESL